MDKKYNISLKILGNFYLLFGYKSSNSPVDEKWMKVYVTILFTLFGFLCIYELIYYDVQNDLIIFISSTVLESFIVLIAIVMETYAHHNSKILYHKNVIIIDHTLKYEQDRAILRKCIILQCVYFTYSLMIDYYDVSKYEKSYVSALRNKFAEISILNFSVDIYSIVSRIILLNNYLKKMCINKGVYLENEKFDSLNKISNISEENIELSSVNKCCDLIIDNIRILTTKFKLTVIIFFLNINPV